MSNYSSRRNPLEVPEKDSAWGKADKSVTQDRSIDLVQSILVTGNVQVVVYVVTDPSMISMKVAGKTAEAVTSVKTYIDGKKLVIESDSVEGDIVNGNIVIGNSTGNIVIGSSTGTSINRGKVVVGVVLPKAPAVNVQGSGKVSLYGHVANLEAKVVGSGGVDASELIAENASLSVTGNGKIKAFIRSEVRASVTGSGSIRVLGNPQRCDRSVFGSGNIKFQ